MPMFDYSCNVCDYVFEEYIKCLSATNPKCPKCSNITTKLLCRPLMIGVDGPRKPSTPIESHKGTITRMAHYADRNTGKSLGYVPAGSITE